MTQTPLSINRTVFTIGIPLALFGTLIFLIKSTVLQGNDTLNLAITADLLLTVPLVYYLLIRKSNIPKTTVVPVMILGLLIGSYFLPKESQNYIELFKYWALPVIEVSILTFVVFKVRKAVKAYRNLKNTTPDFFDTLKNVCTEILPKRLVLPFSTEVAVFYYGFINWKERTLQSNEFSYHKRSGTPSLLGGFIMIIVIETIALHFLLSRWSPVAAWVLSGLSVYTAIQVFGFAKALSKRPISIEDNTLRLRYGVMNETQIPFSDIESVVGSSKKLEKHKHTKTLSPLGELERHNIIISLKNENTLVGLYGFKKTYTTIGFHVDDSLRFIEKLQSTLQHEQ